MSKEAVQQYVQHEYHHCADPMPSTTLSILTLFSALESDARVPAVDIETQDSAQKHLLTLEFWLCIAKCAAPRANMTLQ